MLFRDGHRTALWIHQRLRDVCSSVVYGFDRIGSNGPFLRDGDFSPDVVLHRFVPQARSDPARGGLLGVLVHGNSVSKEAETANPAASSPIRCDTIVASIRSQFSNRRPSRHHVARERGGSRAVYRLQPHSRCDLESKEPWESIRCRRYAPVDGGPR